MKTFLRRVFILLGLLVLLGCGQSQLTENDKISELSSPDFAVYKANPQMTGFSEDTVYNPPFENENQPAEKSADKSILDWVPNGTYPAKISKDCYFNQIEGKSFLDEQSRSDFLQKWVNKCQTQWTRNAGNKFKTLLSFATVKYNIFDNPNVHKVKITLSNGIILRGILGIKKDTEQRPLVIVQAGVHSNADDSPANRNFIMQLFDEAPFNFLLLGNVTGSDFLQDNGILTLGGLEEGRQIVEVAQLLRNQESNIKHWISDVHVLGVSLGGHAALYSSLYNSFLQDKPIQSVMAYCPVVNLEKTMESVTDETLRGWYYSLLTEKLLKKVFHSVPVLSQLLNINDKWDRDTLRKAVEAGSFKRYNQLSLNPLWGWRPFDNFQIPTVSTMWETQEFLNFTQKIKTPTQIFYSVDDYLVLAKLNGKTVLDQLKKQPNPNLGVVEFKRGNHCAKSVANGWPTVSSLLRTYFLSHSYKQSDYLSQKIRLSDIMNVQTKPFLKKLTKGQIHSHFEFEIKQSNIRLNFLIFDKDKLMKCKTYKYYNAPSDCFNKEYIDLPIRGFANVGIQLPVNEYQETKLARWLNTHVIPWTADEENLIQTNKWPTDLLVYGKFE